MSWTHNNRQFLRIVVLILFILSVLGPWVFDQLYVPAEYPCGKPTVRLEGDFCGYPMNGFLAFAYIFSGLSNLIGEWMRGGFAGQGFQMLFIFLAPLILLPFFSTLIAVWRNHSWRWQITNLVMLGLACILLLLYMIILSQSRGQLEHAWGLWIYVLAAISVTILECIFLKTSQRP